MEKITTAQQFHDEVTKICNERDIKYFSSNTRTDTNNSQKNTRIYQIYSDGVGYSEAPTPESALEDFKNRIEGRLGHDILIVDKDVNVDDGDLKVHPDNESISYPLNGDL